LQGDFHEEYFMKTLRRTLFLGLLSFCLLAGCGGGSNSDFKNQLTFGTGLSGNGFDLAGENTTFSLALLGPASQIYFRLESAEDMAGRAVRLYFDAITNKDFTNLQSYGHIFLSAFTITNPGTYTVQAYLVEQVGPDIGKETFVVQADLVMQP
jgi:hypothetical protein